MVSSAPTDRSVEAILAVARTLASTLDLDLLFERILDTLTPVVAADRSTLFLVESTGELRTRVAQGTDRRDLVLPAGTGIAGWVAEHGSSVRLEDAYADPRFYTAWDDETSYRTKSLLCVPFRNAEGTVVGVMQCLNKPDGFSAHDQALLEAIGHQCAVALDNARLVRRLEQRNEELAKAHAQLRKKTDELEILSRLERSIGTARDEDTVLREALGLVCELFDTRDASALLVGDVSVVVSVHASDAGEPRQEIRMRTKRISRQWADALLLRFDGPTLSGDEEGHHVVSAIEVDGQRLGALQIVRLAAVEESGLRVLSMIAGRVGRAISALREQAVNDRDERLQML
ncbi:MAG: GAF domain-containing protein, partial [Myxococcales bacterium]|nr:GAF domain-containing protein [Myxococcales bacterium]